MGSTDEKNPVDQIAAEAELVFDKITGNEYNTRADGINLIKSAIEKATDFYKCRCDALQQAQKEMRDPERQMVCDILANGYRDKIIEASRAAHASEDEIWKQANIVCALSGAVARDCDHYGITRPTWWKAVKKLQKLINSKPAHASEEKITRADIQTTGEKIPYFGHMRKS